MVASLCNCPQSPLEGDEVSKTPFLMSTQGTERLVKELILKTEEK